MVIASDGTIDGWCGVGMEEKATDDAGGDDGGAASALATDDAWFDVGCGQSAGPCDAAQWISTYATLYNAAYDAIVAEQPSAKVLISLEHHFGTVYDSPAAASPLPAPSASAERPDAFRKSLRETDSCCFVSFMGTLRAQRPNAKATMGPCMVKSTSVPASDRSVAR